MTTAVGPEPFHGDRIDPTRRRRTAVDIEDLESELERLRQERHLYLSLLNLGAQTEPESFLKEALALVVEITSARNGYIELTDPDDRSGEFSWNLSHGFSPQEAEDARSRVSSGIIAEAIASGLTIDTPSALLDPRFSDRGSVRAQRIDAVLCVPISSDPPLGVVYLQGRKEPGPFSEQDREDTESFAHHLARLARRLIDRVRAGDSADPTAAARAQLDAHEMIGRSDALAELLGEMALVSPLDVSVLLTGESGTGKSLTAQLIHRNGPRAAGPFVELNCGALPENLVESELFGAMEGSHSTATRDVIGKVEAAEGGTLFLDEVGDLTRGAQAKLLHLLQSRSYTPLGATEVRSANVRVIAATNVDLEAAVAEGRFREDLYFRLHVLPIEVPSLERRRADIPALARSFVDDIVARHRLPELELSVPAARALEAAEWPGNVRQLEHAIEAAAIRAAGSRSRSITIDHFFPHQKHAEGEGDGPMTFQEATREFQARLLRQTLEDTGWNVSETARRLDIARSHLYKLIRAFGIERG